MAQKARIDLRRQETTTVWLKWVRDSNDREVPCLDPLANDHPQRGKVLDYFEVESVEEFADELTGGRIDTRRLGILVGAGEDAEFYGEADLFALVEGVNDDLAENVVEEVGDIPTICEQRRRDGDVFLGELKSDLEVEGADWADDLAAFIETFSEHDNLEKRMKNTSAGSIWVEPDNVTAEGY